MKLKRKTIFEKMDELNNDLKKRNILQEIIRETKNKEIEIIKKNKIIQIEKRLKLKSSDFAPLITNDEKKYSKKQFLDDFEKNKKKAILKNLINYEKKKNKEKIKNKRFLKLPNNNEIKKILKSDLLKKEIKIQILENSSKKIQNQIKKNFVSKNEKINKKLLNSFFNSFFIYQKEIIELLIDDLIDEEVIHLNEIEKNKKIRKKILARNKFENPKIKSLYDFYENLTNLNFNENE